MERKKTNKMHFSELFYLTSNTIFCIAKCGLAMLSVKSMVFRR